MSTVTLPTLYDAADSASLEGQRWFLRARRLQLGSLVIAAVFGLLTYKVGSVDLAGLIVLAAFACVLVSQLLVDKNRPQRAWYEGRAAAESIKHLAWKYAVRADPFVSDVGADDTFVERIKETLNSLDSLRLPPASGDQITGWMRDTRKADPEERRTIYLKQRLRNQQDWYTSRAREHHTTAFRWRLALYGLVIAGALAGVAKTLSVITVDVIGVAATAVSAVTAWVESKQFDNLAVAYGAASHDLAANYALGETVSTAEETWSKFVNDAEDTISKEHRVWAASRTGRIR